MVSDAEWVRESTSRSRPQSQNPEEVIVLNEHRRLYLREVDNADFSWIHLKICFIAGAGFFTAAYDVFVISIVVTMLGYVYGNENGDLSPWQSTGLKVATPVGNLVGQLVFGWLADVLGRRRMYGAELVLIVTATFGQALAAGGPASAVDIIPVLILWRFVMGVGCGGDYPVSAIMMSEFAPTRSRGRLMTAVFACQGWGQLAAGLVGMITVVAFRGAIQNADYPATEPLDYAWRIVVGLGCVPGLIAYFFRLTIPETPRFTMDIERNITRATRDINNILSLGRRSVARSLDKEKIVTAPRASLADFTTYFSKWKNLKVLIGTSYSWFALDIPFFSLTLNVSTILTYSNFGRIDGTSPNVIYESLFKICSGSLVLAVAGFIPGFWASFFVIDSWGRRPIQIMGFTVLSALFFVMAFAFVPLNSTGPGQHAFIFLYCLANFFLNFGPNTTTFIVPGEAFPTRYRSTAHGISAACGKLGAIVAELALGQPFLENTKNMQTILRVLSFVMMTGIVSSALLIPETKHRSLEDLSNESQDDYITGSIERGVPIYP